MYFKEKQLCQHCQSGSFYIGFGGLFSAKNEQRRSGTNQKQGYYRNSSLPDYPFEMYAAIHFQGD